MGGRTIIVCTILMVLPLILVRRPFNNSCTNYWSYFNLYFSPNCYYNPDVGKDVVTITHSSSFTNKVQPEIVTRHTGLCETHLVRTQDGYILSLFRIPRENPKDVIFFQHPMNWDSRIWVAQSENSIAFRFWKAGYDVWLGNHRGTLYSKRHQTLQPHDPRFWDYNLQEIGFYDNNASIEVIKTVTKRETIVYFGYSIGGTAGHIYASLRPEDAARSVKLMITMAPATYIQSLGDKLAAVKFIYKRIPEFSNLTGIYSMTQHNGWFLTMARVAHHMVPFKQYYTYLISKVFGWTPEEFDPGFANLAFAQFGSEVSLKVVSQYYDSHERGGCLRLKDSSCVPIEKINIPVFLVYSKNDSLSRPEDNEVLWAGFPAEAKKYGRLEVQGFNHMDFAFGKRRNLVYDQVLGLLHKTQ